MLHCLVSYFSVITDKNTKAILTLKTDYKLLQISL